MPISAKHEMLECKMENLPSFNFHIFDLKNVMSNQPSQFDRAKHLSNEISYFSARVLIRTPGKIT